MRTLQGMRMRTEYMMEQIRMQAIKETFEKFKEADRRYYETNGEQGGAEAVRLIKELEKLGANMELVFETDLQIRDEVCGI